MSNLSKVQAIYEAFGRGDVPAILEKVSPDVEWEYGGTPEVPWLEARRGREGAGAFFGAVMEHMEIRALNVKQILEGQNGLVVVVMDIDFNVKSTGKNVVEEDEIHLWHFDAAGRVVRFRHRVDTLRHANAYKK